MAKIDIYPGASNSAGGAYSPGSAGGYSSANALAYAALAGGGGSNIVVWRGGSRIVREGPWWGLSAKWACEKRIEHQIDSSFGSDTVITDGWQRYGPSDTTGVWDASRGLWYIDVFTTATAVRDNSVDRMFFGARAGNTLASMVWGRQYKQADSAAQVGSTGTSRAAMLGGVGIWYYDPCDSAGRNIDEWTAFNGGNPAGFDPTIARIRIWTPGPGFPPAVYWEGLAVAITPSDVSTSLVATPRYSPFCAGRGDGGFGNDPSGTIVRAGFVTCGTTLHHTGANKDSKQALPVTGILYESIRCYGGKYLSRLGSNTVGSTLTDYTINGGFHDDLVDPLYFPLGVGDSSGGSEVLSLGYRAKSASFYNIDVICGITHGVVNFGGPITDDAEERNTNCRAIGGTARCRQFADDARGLSVTNSDDSIVQGWLFDGFNTRGHWGGKNTLLHSLTWQNQQNSATDPATSRAVCDMRRDLDGPASGVSVKARRITIDRRGDYARGILEPWGCLEVRGTPSAGPLAFAAATLDLQDSVLLADTQAPISAPIWASHTSQAPSLNQTVSGVMVNTATQLVSGSGTTTVPSGGTTFTGYFSGGTVSRITVDPAGEVLSRPDRPTNRFGELALSGAA